MGDATEEYEEEFSYPGGSGVSASPSVATDHLAPASPAAPEDPLSSFTYAPRSPVVRFASTEITPEPASSHQPAPPPPPATPSPSPAQLEAIYAAASSGDLVQLQRLFRTAAEDQGVDAFSLANDATSRTGLTPLHAACSRGHLDVAQWRK